MSRKGRGPGPLPAARPDLLVTCSCEAPLGPVECPWTDANGAFHLVWCHISEWDACRGGAERTYEQHGFNVQIRIVDGGLDAQSHIDEITLGT